MPTQPPRVHFSFRSPYSWMAIQRLRALRPSLAAQIAMIPFWDPDQRSLEGLHRRGATFHYVQMSKAKHLYLLHDTKRLAAREGLRVAWPVDISPWWERPHLGWLAARRQGAEWALYDALCQARWGRGEDICTEEVLECCAKEADLQPALVLGAVDDPDIREEADQCLYAAWKDDIFGIPYFRIGRHRMWGLDRLEQFIDAVDAAGARSSRPDDAMGTPPGVEVAYDLDTAGGCG